MACGVCLCPKQRDAQLFCFVMLFELCGFLSFLSFVSVVWCLFHVGNRTQQDEWCHVHHNLQTALQAASASFVAAPTVHSPLYKALPLVLTAPCL